jgi:hypothetical protein
MPNRYRGMRLKTKSFVASLADAKQQIQMSEWDNSCMTNTYA